MPDALDSKARPYKLVGAVAVFFVLWFVLGGLQPDQRAVGAIFGLAVVLWMIEALPLPVTALLATVLLVLFGVNDARAIFSSFGDPVIMLFLGSFLLAKAMAVSGLDRRLSFLILRNRWATRTPGALMLTIGAVSCVFSLFVSNTAITAMMLPICISILKFINIHDLTRKYPTGFLLMAAWGSSVAVGTMQSTPPNLIGLGLIERQTDVNISYVRWMLFGMPITLIMLLGVWLLLRFLYAREDIDAREASDFARQELADLGKLSDRERNTLIAFSTALVLWVGPGMAALALGEGSPGAEWLDSRITPAVAALVGAFVLFVLPAHSQESGRTLSWNEAARIDWGTILLFGGGIALGRAVLETGLASTFGHLIASATGISSQWGIAGLAAGLSGTVSEFASNTASATAVIPVSIGLAESASVSPVPAALAATFGASLGFMLPISTPPNAIIYGSGLVPLKKMVWAGLLVHTFGMIVILLVLRFLLPLMGLTN